MKEKEEKEEEEKTREKTKENKKEKNERKGKGNSPPTRISAFMMRVLYYYLNCKRGCGLLMDSPIQKKKS